MRTKQAMLVDASLPKVADFINQDFFTIDFYESQAMLYELLAYHTHKVLICRANLPINSRLVENSALKLIASASSGIDHIDLPESFGIQILSAPGANADAVCDYTMATIAWLAKNQYLMGKKVGIIGFGEVGSRIARQLANYNFIPIISDPYKQQLAILEDLSDCDVISINTNLHDGAWSTRKLLDQKFLARFNPDGVIINTARGEIVDENAIMQHKIQYCTDVYRHEPEPGTAIIDHALLCTPHIAGHSQEGKLRAVATVCAKIHAYYQIAAPSITEKTQKFLPFIPSFGANDWPDYLLKLYNPIRETELLKKAADKAQAFAELRKAHTWRHDFGFYAQEILGEELCKNT